MKKHRKTIIITSIVTLMPIIAGLLLWDRMPDRVVTHWGSDNVPDGWSSKSFAVFGIPAMLLAIQALMIFITLNDPKKKNIGDRMLDIVFWIIPLTSLVACLSTYGIAAGYDINIGFVMNLLVGVIFIFLLAFQKEHLKNLEG